MPRLNAAEFDAVLAEGSIGAFTVDTSIFDRFACDLDAPTLQAIAQFAGSPVALLLTDIVLGEVRSHMIRDALEATGKARAALREVAQFRRPVPAVAAALADGLGGDAGVDAEVDAGIMVFMVDTEATVLKAGALLDADRLVGDYFLTRPPFHAGKGKRAEFPDAIALGELERWGEENGRLVLAVAADAGWAEFAESSRWVLVVDDLAAALALFHRVDAHTVDRAAALLADPDRAAASELAQVVRRYVDGINPEVHAHTPMFFDAELEGISLVGLEPPAGGDMSVIASDAHSVTLAASVSATVEAEASFGFSMRDYWDGDAVQVGSTYQIKELSLEVLVVIRVTREGGPDDAVEEIRAEGGRHVTLYFGQVEPTANE